MVHGYMKLYKGDMPKAAVALVNGGAIRSYLNAGLSLLGAASLTTNYNVTISKVTFTPDSLQQQCRSEFCRKIVSSCYTNPT